MTTSPLEMLALGVAVFAASACACALVRQVLPRWMVLDTPNQRSSHSRPVPRGGGLGFLVVILVAWVVLWLSGSVDVTVAVLLGACAVGAVSFADDLGGVSLTKRLLVQAAAIAAALWYFPSDARIVSDFLPAGLDRIVAGVAWLWFVNLFNFMDGIDGIAAGEGAVVAFGVVVLATFRPDLGLPAPEAIAVGAAALAFLLFNWPPARIFMGDIGSTGLGFLLGWLLLTTATKGALVPALLLPLYFVADASTTLLYRAWRRQSLGEAHRDHAYQRAVDGGLGHALVSSRVVILGVILIAMAIVAAAGAPIAAFGAGAALTAAFVIWLRTRMS